MIRMLNLTFTGEQAGLFSAVASAFIIDVQSQLQPDYAQMSYALLKIIASTSLGNVPTGPDAAFPRWTGPDPAIVHVQAILYSSLAASLLSAFIAMLGKQWLNRFAQVEISGSIADRSRNRVRKLDGMVTWHFDLVMECLPLMLQVALLLLGYALSNYLFFVNRAVAGVLIGFTTFGLLFYSLIVLAATLSYTCPFQTPLSLVLRFVIRFDNEHRRYLRRFRKWIGRMFSYYWKRKTPRARSPGPHDLGGTNTADENIVGSPIEMAIIGSPHQPPSSSNKAVWYGSMQDSDAIFRLFGISTDPDVVLTITKFIPEIVWHAGVRTTPLEKLYDTVLECFDSSSGRLVVISKLRNEAYFAAKALLHLAIQRQCIGDGSDEALFMSISDRHQILGAEHYEGDSDLESTLSILDRVIVDFRVFEPISWPNFSPTTTHLAWMSHILLYRAWDAHRKGYPPPEDVRQFVLHSFRLDPPPGAPIIADCLFIIGLVLGTVKFRIGDLLVTDKSKLFHSGARRNHKFPQIGRIYEELSETFRSPSPTTDQIDRALKAMEIIAPLTMDEIATESFHLFHLIMRTSVSDTCPQEKKWQAARHAMHGAYKWDKFLPWIGDPQDILVFLGHHFELATRYDENQDEPIHDALRALAYASDPATIEALNQFDPTEPSFVHGVLYIYQENHPFQLRKAALFFLPLIGDRWFNTPDPIMEPHQMGKFCADWASAIDGIEHTPDVQKAALAVLFDMMNSPHWRPHIVPNKWKLLEYFTLVPDDIQPLKRCLDNLELTNAISEVENPAAMVLWLAVLWLKYNELVPAVREQLETATKRVAQGNRRTDLEMYLSVMNTELKKAEDALAQYNLWSTDPAAIALRTKIDSLRQARAALVHLKGG